MCVGEEGRGREEERDGVCAEGVKGEGTEEREGVREEREREGVRVGVCVEVEERGQ